MQMISSVGGLKASPELRFLKGKERVPPPRLPSTLNSESGVLEKESCSHSSLAHLSFPPNTHPCLKQKYTFDYGNTRLVSSPSALP